MTIYKKRTPSYIYRKIYEQHHGSIPRDDDGRTYDIHHIDGDDTNNDPKNLVAIPIQEHYDIHYKQGDFGACFLMSLRMDMTVEERSELSRKTQNKKVENGTHHLLRRPDGSSIASDKAKNGDHPFQKRSDGSSVSKDKVDEGTHIFLDNEWQLQKAQKQVIDGTHNFLRRPDGTSVQTDKISKGTHHLIKDNPNNSLVCCMECRKVVARPMFSRWHGDKCKSLFTDTTDLL
jgi:hypothetical protein